MEKIQNISFSLSESFLLSHLKKASDIYLINEYLQLQDSALKKGQTDTFVSLISV